MDCRVETENGKKRIECSWEGSGEMESANGRGWAAIEDNELRGRILFHQGDDSTFRAKKSG